MPAAHERRAELGVVDVGTGPCSRYPWKMRTRKRRKRVRAPVPLLGFPRMSERQLYRLRAPSTGRELLLPAEPGKVYRGP